MFEKIGLLVGTNRQGAMSLKMAQYYRSKLEASGKETVLIELSKLPNDFPFSALYGVKNEEYAHFQKLLDSVAKIFIFVPEYNGSFPGVLKTFIDGLRYPDSFLDKKIALVGLSSGVLGNAVGLGHLEDILGYMGGNVMGLRVKLGLIEKNFDEEKVTNQVYEKFINQQIEKFLAF